VSVAGVLAVSAATVLVLGQVGVSRASLPPPVTSPATVATSAAVPTVDARLQSLWSEHAEKIGRPAEPAVESDGVVRQQFHDGVMYADAQGHAGYVTGGIRVAYDSSADAGDVGTPLGVQVCVAKGTACYQAFTAGTILWSGDDGAQVVPAAKTLRLKVAANFRDVAGEGAGLPVAGGRTMKRGVVYRSDRLTGAETIDRLALRSLGLTDIYDLRTTETARRSPDPSIKGATYHLVNLFGTTRTPDDHPGTVAQVESSMKRMNERFVTDPVQRARLRNVLEAVAGSEGPVLIHCTEGKDRTGWTSAMLQLIAGADERAVLEQYLASNEYRKAVVAVEVEKVGARQGSAAARLYRAQRVLDASYLEAGLAAARARYGSVARYLRAGVGLSEETLRQLRERLVDPR
jgi:protein-tyrosine phosphatase